MNSVMLAQFTFITISIGWKYHEARDCCTNAIVELNPALEINIDSTFWR